MAAAASGASQKSNANVQATDILTHVTFASCNRQSADQSFWMKSIASTIAAQREKGGAGNSSKPHTDLLLWLGNAVYADVDEAGVAISSARHIDSIKQEYKLLIDNLHYREFVKHVVGAGGRVSGIWDDRDLAWRGADGSYAQSEAIRHLYLTHIWNGYPLSAMDVVGDSTPGALYSFNGIPAPAGTPLAAHFVHSVCTITLDVRTQRTAPPNLVDALLHTTLAEAPDVRARVMEADLLGRRQWAWLERTLATYLTPTASSPGDAAGRAHCAVTLIASPWQILLNDNKPFEGWDLYPASRSRLLLLLKKYDVERFVFLSGHAELGEVGVMRRASKTDLHKEGPTVSLADNASLGLVTPPAEKLLPPRRSSLVEVTSSGLTHTLRDAPLVGRLARWFITPRVAEDTEDDGLAKRRILLTRTTTMERQFGTLQIIGDREATKTHAGAATAPREEVLTRTRVLITLHSVQRAGAPLVTIERTLKNLPSYAVDPDEGEEKEEGALMTTDIYDAAHLPTLRVYLSPGDYPWLKQRVLELQCVEVPCVKGKHFMLLKVIANLAIAFVFAMVFISALYCFQLKYPNVFAEEHVKLKQD
ncbi:hypothetical protein JKF63_04175 [Porcisia hertigi]|uniref:Uncharacterized protein n=1 Tax=Porcisia hertigi TaxID=2761500 RepID=A0A836LB59_9TRYP|nr:hypothetical protein JKF63_04175 [Porcisia hertigi]